MKKTNLGFKKKGNAVLDLILLSIFLVTLGIITLQFTPVMQEFNADFQSSESSNASKVILQEQTDAYVDSGDNMFLMIFILLWVVLLFGAMQLDSHPVFFIVTVVLMTFAFLVAMILGNVYEENMIDESVVAYADSFPFMNFLMTHFLQVAIVVGFSVVIVMFAKANSGGGGQ